MNKRIEQLRKEMQKSDLSGMLVSPSEDLTFLVGFSPMQCKRFQGLFVTESDLFYVCNRLYTDEIEHLSNGRFPVYSWFDGESMTEVVKSALISHNLLGKRIGVNASAQAFNVLEIALATKTAFLNANPVLEEARIIKTPEEISALKKAAEIADRAFESVLSFVRVGMTELDVKLFLKKKMEEFGGENCSGGIVATGPNSSYPHYHDTGRTILEKDVLLLDYGCSYQNMLSDMTRTLFVGEATEEQKKVYDIVLRANLAGESAAVNDAYIPDVDEAARSIIETEGYGKDFITRLGHGIGYFIHEAPDIKKSNRRNLLPNMAFSIEPGIYLAGRFGVRIEDIVITTDSGNEILNKSTKELLVLCS